MAKERLEIEGIITSLATRIHKIEIQLSQISDEDYAKLLSAGRIKIILMDD